MQGKKIKKGILFLNPLSEMSVSELPSQVKLAYNSSISCDVIFL